MTLSNRGSGGGGGGGGNPRRSPGDEYPPSVSTTGVVALREVASRDLTGRTPAAAFLLGCAHNW